MKRILATLAAIIASTCGCTNEKDYAKDAIDPSMIIGEWISSIEGAGERYYIFYEDGTCKYEFTYLDEYFWGEKENTEYNYTITEGILTLNSLYGGDPRIYTIVKLNESTMEWEWQTNHITFKRVK